MLCCVTWQHVLLGAALGFLYLLIEKLRRPVTSSLWNKHVVVTGGSLGIGKCVAIEAAKQGAYVTIIARSVPNLELALTEIKKNAIDLAKQRIQFLSLDLSSSYEVVEKALLALEDSVGPVYMLVNCAGTSVCGKLEDAKPSDIEYLMKINILGTIYPTKALLSRMKARKEGKIVITSSQAGLLGIFGFSVYSSTKFALRGLAESLQMEVSPYNMSVTLSLPPDTDTPGFAEEEKTKPLETKLISESAGLMPPEKVATQMIKDALNGNFFSTVGFESAMVSTMCAGMSPFSSYTQLLTQVTTLPLLRLVAVLVLYQFKRIVNKCAREREEGKKAE